MIRTLVSTSRPRGLLAVAAAAVVLALAGTTARAGLVISVAGPVMAAPGSTNNFFDVIITNEGADTENLAAFQVSLSVAPTSGVTFTGLTTDTALTYVFDFAGSGSSGPTLITALPDTMLFYFDTTNAPSGPLPTREILAGASFGLGRVRYDASSQIAAATTVTISPSIAAGGDSEAVNASGASILTGVRDGVILRDNGTVQPIPEPATIAGAVAGAASLLMISRRRRRLAA
jgi:hypothetical protein